MLLSEIIFSFFFLLQSYVTVIDPKYGGIASTEVLDRHGERIGFLDFKSNVIPYRLDEIPAQFKNMVIRAEDKNFYSHHGIDYVRTSKVFFNSLSSLKISAGASTITQQWVRARLRLPRTWWSKPLVMLLAVLGDLRYEKDDIFAAYLNHVPFASNIQGVGAAAEYYFGNELTSLTPAEMATLVALIRSPVGLTKPDRAKRLYSLRNHYLKMINEGELSQNEIIDFKLQKPRSKSFGYIEKLSKDIKDRPAVLRSTLDSYLQVELEKLLQEELSRLAKKGVTHGAMMVLDASNGDVLSYIGSADYFSKDAGQIDGLQVPRQPGSLIKAFTYGLGLDSGHSVASIMPDTPGTFRSGAGVYRPRNYDERFTGPRRIREALANSLNLPAVLLVDELSPQRLYSALMNLGLTFPNEADHYGVGLTLGNAEMKPADLIQSFTAFPRLDSWVKARWLKSSPILKFKNPISAESSYLVTDILKDSKARMEAFGERTVFDVPFEMAAKTGTSTDYRDNWAVAWTPTHVVLTWVGNHRQQPMKRVSGITGAGPLTRMAMLKINEKKSFTRFVPPSPPAVMSICALSGQKAQENCPRVLEEKFYKNRPDRNCQWHQLAAIHRCGQHVIVDYPVEFQAWAHENGLDVNSQVEVLCPGSDQIFQILTKNKVQMTYPLDGSVYAVDPDMPKGSQKLPLKMSGFTHGLEWEVDGERYMPTSSEGTFDWPLERGKHVIRLISGNDVKEEVEIFVR